MSSLYGGTNAFPTSLTIPSDGDPRNAAAVNVPIIGLADRTTYLKANTDALHTQTDNLGMLNWPGANALTGRVGVFLAYDALYGRTWVASSPFTGSGITQNCVYDYGAGLPLGSDVVAGSLAGDTSAASDIACDTLGNVVLSENGRYVYVTPGSAPVSCVKTDVFGAAMTSPVGSAVCYNALQGKWVWVCNQSTSAVTKSSTNRTVWSTGGAPAWGTITFLTTFRVACRQDTGLVMMLGYNGASVFSGTSTDSGTSWSVKATMTTSISAATGLSLSFDNVNKLWFCTVNKQSGSEVWVSANDGTSWTKQATLSVGIGQIVTNDGVTYVSSVVGSGPNQNFVVRSLDQGVTWYSIGVSPSIQAIGVSGTQLITTGNSYVVVFSNNVTSQLLFSLRTGSPAFTLQVT